MKDDTIEIPVTTSLSPVCFKDFACLAADCKEDCCHGWGILFNKKDYLSMRREDAPAEFKERLDAAVVRLRGADAKRGVGRYAGFKLKENGLCPLLDEDGLCSLQKTCGHEALPTVCRTFPRKKYYTPRALQHTMSPACEGVLKLLWEHPEGLDFVEETLNRGAMGTASFDKDPPTLYPWFGDVQSMCIDILQNRALSMGQRMVLLGMAIRALTEMDWAKPDMEGWLARYGALAQSDAAAEVMSALPGDRKLFLTQNLTTAIRISQVKPWAMELVNAMNTTASSKPGVFSGNFEEGRYTELEAALREGLGDIEWFWENLTVSTLWFLSYPQMESKEALWKSYVTMCCVYSFFRFAAVAGCGGEGTAERLFHSIVMASRALLHSNESRMKLRDEFFQHDSATLAHMAILVSG